MTAQSRQITSIPLTRLGEYRGVASWGVPSRSRPGLRHLVTRLPSGAITCTCTAASFGRTCRHRLAVLAVLTESHTGPHIEEETMTVTAIDRSSHETVLGIWTPEELRVIKEGIAGGMDPPISDAELRWFASVCQARRLSPIAGQIIPVRRGGRMVIQVTIHGLRSLADDTGDYAPGRRTTYEVDGQGGLVSATAYVMKHARGQWHEVEETAFWDEYAEWTTDKRTGERRLTQMWAGKPRLMLAKVAEALALRRAFPAQLGSLYTDDELGRHSLGERSVVEHEPQERTPAPPSRPEPARLSPGLPTDMTAWWRSVRESGWDVETIQAAARDSFGKRVQQLDAGEKAELRDAALGARLLADADGTWRIEPIGGDISRAKPDEHGAPLEVGLVESDNSR